VGDIRHATRQHHSAEHTIRIVPEGQRGEGTIAALRRRVAIAESLSYACSQEFPDAGERCLAGDTARAATTGEVQALCHEARALKGGVAEQALELRLLKRARARMGTTTHAIALRREARDHPPRRAIPRARAPYEQNRNFPGISGRTRISLLAAAESAVIFLHLVRNARLCRRRR
jgi:transposase